MYYEDHVIKGSKCVKYLDEIFDQDLSGNSMVSSIMPKAIGKLNFLYRYWDCFSIDLRRILCTCMSTPVILLFF